MPHFNAYHAHIYFDATTKSTAQNVIEQAGEAFELFIGRMHDKPIGPHPIGSCQLSFSAALFAELVPWLAKHRQGLSVLIHPVTGDDLHDHDDYAMWLGIQLPLDTSVF